jgi:hypothetical protein
MKIDFILIQELNSLSAVIDQERYRDKRQHAANDDPLHDIRDDGSPEHDGEHPIEHDDEYPFECIS